MIGFVVRLVRAVWYLSVAAFLFVALPWIAIRYVGWPLPRRLPDGPTFRDWVDNPFTPTRFWKAATVVGWMLWASMVYLFGSAVVHEIRRTRMPRFRLAAPLQGLAAGVVGAAATALSSGAASAAGAPPPAAVAAATVPDVDLDAGSEAVTGTATRPDDGDDVVYVVRRGDWLSGIADRFLGDPDAYPRLAALNPQLEARDSRFPHHIEAGWRIRLPADAADRGIRLHAAGHVLQPSPQPAQTTPTPTPAPPATPTAKATAAVTDEDDDQVAPPVTPASAPTDERSAGARSAPAATSPPRPGVVVDRLVDGADDGHPDVVVDGSRVGLMSGAGLLASLLFALLTAERRRQRSFFAAGQEPPLPRNGRAERELRAAQQPADVERLDAALRSLGHGLAGRGVPDIVGVRLVGGDVHVLLADPDDDPPAPWLDEGTQWALPGYVQPPDTDHPATLLPLLVTVGSRAGRHLLIDLDRLSTLTITGHPHRTRDMLRHIACELACNTWTEQAAIVLAGFGDEGDVFAEIGPDRVSTTGSVAEAVDLVRTELGRRRATGAGAPMVLLVAGPDAAARASLAELHHDLAGVGRCGIAVVTTATASDTTPIGAALLTVTDEAVLKIDLPGLRLSTDAALVPVDMLDPMAQVFRTARLSAPAPQPAQTVTQAQPEKPGLPDWDERVDPGESVLALFDPTTPDPTTPDPAVQQASVAVEAASMMVADPGGDEHGHGGEHERDVDQLDVDLAAWRAGDSRRPRVGILGTIEVFMPGQFSDSRHRLYTEMLLYLLTRPNRSADRASIEDALWYGNPAGEGTVRKAISVLRRWLGQRVDGLDWIPERDIDGIYRLEQGVLLDWHLVQRLRRRAHTRGPDGIGDYVAALELVRGVPMRNIPDTGPYRRPYTWIGESDIAPGRIIATITDIAHRVAQHYLAHGDTATARWAIDQAWHADPDRGFDDLWHDRMRAEHLDDQHAALRQLIAEYLKARDAEILEDLPSPVYNRVRELVPDAA